MKPIPKKKIQDSKFWIPKQRPSYTSTLSGTAWFDIKYDSSRTRAQPKPKDINIKVLRCAQITIKPSQTQRAILKSWLEVYRRIYNLTVKYFRKHRICGKYKAQDLIDYKIDNDANLKSLRILIEKTKTPKHTRNNAIFDVVKAYETAMKNLKAKNIKFFRLRYKKLSKPTQILVLEPQSFNSEGTGLKFRPLRNLNPSSSISTDCNVRLQYNCKTKKFTLFVPQYRTNNKTVRRFKQCALDPGLRTFQTVYSNSKIYYQFATAQTNKDIRALIDRVEKVKSKSEESWYKKYTDRLRTKIHNKIADLHWKTARYLCGRFENIMIGKLSTKGIIKSYGSILTPAQKRYCMALSHFTFRERLKSKCEEFGVNFKCVDESYTSKTCGKCGELNENLKGSEIFKCDKPGCGYVMNRDVHGARNILIKHT